MCEAGVGRDSRLEGRCLDVVGKEPKPAYPYTPTVTKDGQVAMVEPCQLPGSPGRVEK